MKGRRVGTISGGLLLVVFGVLFLLRTFIPAIDYRLIFSVWPIALIFVGIEMVVAFVINREEKLKYDGVSVFLVISMTLFSFVMAALSFAMEQAAVNGYWYW